MRPLSTRVRTLLVATLVLGGCVFVEQNPKNNGENDENVETNGATNGETNNATNGETNNETTPTNNTTGIPLESYGEIQVDEVPCADSPVLWFDPREVTGEPLDDDAEVAAAGPANVLEAGLFGAMTAGAAEADGSQMQVTLAVVDRVAPEGGATEPLLWGTFSTPMEGEVLNVVVAGGLFTRIATPEPVVAQVTIATTEEVWECDLVELEQDEPDGRLDCIQSPVAAELDDLVPRPERLDFAPVFDDEIATGDWLWKLTESPIISVLSGGRESETLGIVRANIAMDGELSAMEIPEALHVPSDPGEIYAERMVWGVDTSSFGWPSILLLGRVEEGEYGPVWLKATSTRGDFEFDEDLNWRLSDRLQPERGTFSFVDGYTLGGPPELRPLQATYAIPPGSWKIGYVGIEDGGLVFSRPDSFSGLNKEFVRLDGSFDEIVAYRNLPLAELATGEPLVVAIGNDGTSLSLMNWDFDDRVELVDNVLSGGWSDVQQLSVGVLYNDSGVIGFRGTRNDRFVVGGAPIRNVSNLLSTCQ